MIDLYNISVHHSADGEAHIALTCSACKRVIAHAFGYLLPDLIKEAEGHLRVAHEGGK